MKRATFEETMLALGSFYEALGYEPYDPTTPEARAAREQALKQAELRAEQRQREEALRAEQRATEAGSGEPAADVERFERRRRFGKYCGEGLDPMPDDPTPDELRERAAAIRDGWSESQRRQRESIPAVPWTHRTYTLAEIR